MQEKMEETVEEQKIPEDQDLWYWRTLGVLYQVTEDETLTAEEYAERLFVGEKAAFRDAYWQRMQKMKDEISAKVGTENVQLFVRWVNYKYATKNAQWEDIKLSARVVYCLYSDGGAKPVPFVSSELYVVLQGLVTNADGVSTSGNGVEEAAFSGGRVLVLPDYMGYGASRGTTDFPFWNYALCAGHSLDALRTGVLIARSALSSDWKTYVRGASIGGANALALHRKLEILPNMATELHLAGSECCAGAYSPLLTMQNMFAKGKTAVPALFRMVVRGMISSYPSHFENYQESDFFSRYNRNKSEINAMFDGQTYTFDEINAYFLRTFPSDENSEVRLSDIFSAALLDEKSPLHATFMEMLARYEICEERWIPTFPVSLYHSRNDEIFPYANASFVLSRYGANLINLTPDANNVLHATSCANWLDLQAEK